MKIKVKLHNDICKLDIIKKGDWIDLKAAKTVSFNRPYAQTLKRRYKQGTEYRTRDLKFDFKLIPLGISMQLPPGFEAVVVPRSSLFLNHGLLQTNHFGVIDNTYCGDTDEWKFPAMGFFNTEIIEGTRICQFRIQLSQKATILQKLKWLFNNKIELEYVDHLENTARGGFGSTNHSKL